MHKKISKFFLQFRPQASIDKIRANLENMFKDKVYAADSDAVDIEMREIDEHTNEEKETVLKNIKSVNLPLIMQGFLNSNNAAEAVQFMKQMLFVLRIVLYYQTPSERREIADELMVIFQHFIPTVPKLVQLLTLHQQPALQRETLKILSLLIPGPRIGSTPEGTF